MKTIDFCNKYSPCRDGREFALEFETMTEVWNACEHPDWLFWILEKHAPLEKEQSVRLAIAFAETCLVNLPEGEDRPRLAIEAAKAWLANPCEETASAAESAARSAWAARSAARSAWAAWAAAWTAAESARSARSAAWAAESAARSAWAARSAAESAAESAESGAWAAARSAWTAAESAARSAWEGSAARSQQCNILREAIPNPFKP